MRNLFYFLFVASMFMACSEETNREDTFFVNEKFIILSTNQSEARETQDKSVVSTYVKVWLIQRINESSQDSITCCELTNNEHDGFVGFHITNALWYNKAVGDTLFFEYILKERFFKMHKKFVKNTDNFVQEKEESFSESSSIDIDIQAFKVEQELEKLKEMAKNK